MNNTFFVFLGGGIGTLLRHCIGIWCPFGFKTTLIINISGSFFIGLCAGIQPSILRNFVVTGILGGYTTFSAFQWETLQLIQEGSLFLAISYILLLVIASLIAVALGFYLPLLIK